MNRSRVLMTTEGTYPYIVGGVSSWCRSMLDALDEHDWTILPLAAGDQRRRLAFDLPGHVTVRPPLELWSMRSPVRGPVIGARTATADWVPSRLAADLLAWRTDLPRLRQTLAWCHRNGRLLRAGFRSRAGWNGFLDAMQGVLDERPRGARPLPSFDLFEAARLYQTLYWVARTAAAPLPPADLVHVTAAGWSAIPAVVHRDLHGTPVLLTEHGLFVREAYLAAIRLNEPPSSRWAQTRLARGLARLAYDTADLVCPVTEAHRGWERSFGVPDDRIRVIVNGVDVPADPTPPPRERHVMSIGRLDPLKDIGTLLRVAARVLSVEPQAVFHHYGPVSDGQQAYAAAMRALHGRLGLGDRFVFHGSTRDPDAVIQAADVVVLTSISEGLPMAALEAMANSRPVVATNVGGVSDALLGCGLITAPGDVAGIADAIRTLLNDTDLAGVLGDRGRRRVERRYSRDACISAYRSVLDDLLADSRQREPAVAG
jgi:polysaccharide biosynthesis protein PelF